MPIQEDMSLESSRNLAVCVGLFGGFVLHSHDEHNCAIFSQCHRPAWLTYDADTTGGGLQLIPVLLDFHVQDYGKGGQGLLSDWNKGEEFINNVVTPLVSA